MASSPLNSSLLISHAYLCGIDPLFHSYVKILARVLHFMIPVEGFNDPPLYFFCFPPTRQPRPIRLVTVAGIVVFATTYQKFASFIIDDGSATVNCMIWTNDKMTSNNVSRPETPYVKNAEFVHASGELQWKRGKPVVVVDNVQHYDDPHAELLWWAQLERIHKRIYCKSFPIMDSIPTSSHP